MLSLFLALTTSVSAANVYDTVCSGSFAAGETTALCQILGYSAYSSVKSTLQGAGPITFFPVSNQGLSAAKWTPDFWQNPSNYEFVSASLQYLIFNKAVKSTDLQPGVMSVFETLLQPGTPYANTSKAQVAGFYENPNYPPGNAYFCYGRDAFDVFSVSYQIYDVACDNGVVQFMNRLPPVPLPVLTQLKYAGFSQFLQAIQKSGLSDLIATAQGLTLFAPFDDVMLSAQWNTLALSDLSSLVMAHVYVASKQGQNGAVQYTGTFTDTTLVDAQGQPTIVKMSNGLPMLYGAANTDQYPSLPARVIQNQILVYNGVLQPVTNVILSKPITFSKVPLLPQQWTATTIDPPQQQGQETYFWLDTYQAGNYYPSAHGFYYGAACSKLETVSGTQSYVYYLNCPALCCYEVLGGDVKQWSISQEATYLGNQTIQSFGKSIEAEGWEMIYNPNTLAVTYDYWVTYDATNGSPILQRIDYSGVGVPTGAIQYQNFAEIPASQAQAFPSEFWLPQNCQPTNLLPCDPNEAARLGREPAMTPQQRLETLVRFGDIHRVKNSPLEAPEARAPPSQK